MSPFTPFLAEHMYQNLSHALPAGTAQPSVHFCDVPEAEPEHEGDARIQESVARMQVLGLHGRMGCMCYLQCIVPHPVL